MTVVALLLATVLCWMFSETALKHGGDTTSYGWVVSGLALTVIGDLAYMFLLKRGLLEAHMLTSIVGMLLAAITSVYFFNEKLNIYHVVGLLSCVVAVTAFAAAQPEQSSQNSAQIAASTEKKT